MALLEEKILKEIDELKTGRMLSDIGLEEAARIREAIRLSKEFTVKT
jgi:uncharacterized protein YjiS (DUF1127 family)